jgi:hypothetical protein
MLDSSHVMFLVLASAVLFFSFRDMTKTSEQQASDAESPLNNGDLNDDSANSQFSNEKKIPNLKIKSNIQTLKFMFW